MAGYEEGIHQCTVVSQGFGNTKKGTEYFALIVRPNGGQFERAVSLWVNSDPNIERTRSRLMSLGWDGEDWTALNPGAEDGHSFAGITLTLVNRHREEFDNFDFPGPPPTVRVGKDDELAKKLNRLTKSGKKKPAVTNVSPAVTNPSPVSDEEVPF